MKTKSLFLLVALLLSGVWQNLQAQCNASFTMNPGPGLTVAFTNTSTGNYTAMSWYFGDGSTSSAFNPSHTYAAAGIYGVCLTVWDSLNGCQSTQCDTLVLANPGGCQSYFSAFNINGSTVSFNNMSTGTGLTYLWNFGDGSTSAQANPTHAYTQSGSFTVCLTITGSNGCTDTYCGMVSAQVASPCNANFSAYDSTGMTWFFPAYNPNYDYFWSFGDGSNSTQPFPIHQYAAPGTYLVCLTVIDSTAGCSDTWCDSVTYGAAAPCAANFTYQQNNGVVNFYGYNAGGGSVNNYYWSFGDGTFGTGQNPVHTYTSSGNYTVCLTIMTAAGCADTLCGTLTINIGSSCNASFGYQSSNNTGSFSGSATGGTVTSWAWYFSDGTTASGQNVTHTFPGSGYWTACLFITTANGCSDSTCQLVYIAGPISACQPYFSYTPGSNNTIVFTDQSVGNPTNYYWNFGDGTTSTAVNPVHQYAQNGVYTVCLTIVDSAFGCSATYCDSVIIGNIIGNCNAQFQYFDSLGTYFFFSNASPSYNYYWTFGDGTISYAANPTHIYSNSGGYMVCLTVTDSLNNCSDTWCDSLFIGSGAGCQAYFTYSADTVTFATAFTNLSQGNFISVIWSFGDGTSSSAVNPNHTYTNPGTYIVCLSIFGSNGCQSSYCDSVVIGSGSNCIPQFYAVPDSVFGNGNVTFYVNNQCPGYVYTWTFGDSTSGTGTGPFIHQYNATGWYLVCVTATDSLGNVITWCDSVYAYRIGMTGLQSLSNAIPVSIFPNPSNGPFTLAFDLQNQETLTIEILSIEGQLIQRIVRDYPSGLSEIRLDPSLWEAGIYIVRLRTAEYQTNSRLTIQH